MSKTSNPTGCAAFAPSLTATELTHQFIQTKRKVRKYNDDSEYLECLGYACGLLATNRADFTQSQFLVLTRAFHDSSDATHALLNLFEEWLAFMRLHKKIKTEFVIDYHTHRWL